jgi:outer membrane protein assembly factor BamB
MNENDFFTPENIQQSIDQLSQLAAEAGPDHHNVQPIVALQHIYHREEERASIELVRQRLTSRYASFAPTKDTQGQSSSNSEMVYFNAGESETTKKTIRKPIIPRALSIIAALLVISFIAGNWFVVTRFFPHHQGTSVASTNKVRDNVYLAGKQAIYKLNGNTGAVVWQRRLSTPGAISIKTLNGMIYAVQYSNIYAINPADGTIRWHKNSITDAYVTVIAQDNTLYLSGDYQPDKRHIDTLFLALNAHDGSQRWRNTTLSTGYGQWFTVQDGGIYVRTNNKDGLYAIDAATGRLRWQSHEKFDAPGVDELPVVGAGVVCDYYGNHLYALDEKTGRQLWHQKIAANKNFFSAGFYNGAFYISSALFRQQYNNQYEYQELTQAFVARTGAQIWTSPIGYKLLSGVPVTDGLLFTERNYHGSRTISALDAGSGKIRWQFTDSCPPTQCTTFKAVISNGFLYLFEENGMKLPIIAFDIHSGQRLFHHSNIQPGFFTLSTQPAHDRIYLMTVRQKQPNNPNSPNIITFYAYQLSNDSVLWRHTLNNMGEADFYANDYGPVVAP